MPESTLRNRPLLALLPEHRANRTEIPVIDEVVAVPVIPTVAVDGCEADDVIARYTRLAAEAGWAPSW